MPELSSEIQKKIEKILGIPSTDMEQYDFSEIINELCETVFMLDDQKSIAKITVLREKITSINGRIWNLLGDSDSKKARENFNGIAELERYVGEMKRRSGTLENAHEQDKEKIVGNESRVKSSENRLRNIEKRVLSLQDDLQNLFHTLTDIEAMEEESSGY